MTNGRTDDAGAAMVEHEFELADHQSRVDELEDRLNVVYPAPDTPVGGAQRARLAVPSPACVLTVGARGTAASDGGPIGPGGIAMRSSENLGIEVLGSTVVDTDGLTVTHSVGAVRLLTQADVGIGAADAIRVGTDRGNVEITAGRVHAPDPGFTVVPDQDVPDGPPEVDTAGPRSDTESRYSASSIAWRVHDAASALSTWASIHKSGVTSGVAAGNVSARVAGVMGGVRAGWTLCEGVWDSVWGASVAADLRPDPLAPDEPVVKIHGGGGVKVLTPHKVSVFGATAVGLSSLHKVSIKGAWDASLKSIGNAKVYGVLAVAIKSLGAVGIKGKVVSSAGDFVEMKAKQIAAVSSKKDAILQAKEKASVNASQVSIGGGSVHVSGDDVLTLHSKDRVELEAEAQAEIAGTDSVEVRSDTEILIHAGDGRIEVDDSKVRLNAGTQLDLRVEPGSVEIGCASIKRNEVVIRGTVRLG